MTVVSTRGVLGGEGQHFTFYPSFLTPTIIGDSRLSQLLLYPMPVTSIMWLIGNATGSSTTKRTPGREGNYTLNF